MENTSFGGFSAGLHRKNHPAAVAGGILVWRLAPYSPNLNPLDFTIQRVLQAKVQAMPHSNLAALRPSIAAE
jgi:hypothetical protein